MRRAVFILFILLIFGCGELFDIDDSTLAPLNPQIAVPLISTQTSFQEILDATDDFVQFEVDQSGLLSLVYPGDTIDVTAQQLLLPIPVFGEILIADTVSNFSLEFIPGLTIDEAVFKSNSLFFTVIPPDGDSYSITATIPSFRKDGEALIVTFDVPSDMTGQVVQSPFVDLNGIELIGSLEAIDISYDARNSSGERVSFDTLRLDIDFVNFSYVEGAFTTQEFPIPPRLLRINTFSNVVSGEVVFDNPSLEIEINNSFGFPIEPKVNELSIINSSGEASPFSSDLFLPGVILLDFPRIDEEFEAKSTSIELNKDNSNIADIFDQESQLISLDIDAIAFPESSEESKGFISEDSRLNIRTELKVPLEGEVSDYVIFENYPVDSLLELENVEEMQLNLGVKNGLPVNVSFQIHFVSEFFGIIDSLFDEPIIIPPSDSPESQFTTSVIVAQEKIQKILPTRFIRTFIGFIQEENGNVRILNSDEIEIEVGAIIKTEI
jgi:hypothetical protein